MPDAPSRRDLMLQPGPEPLNAGTSRDMYTTFFGFKENPFNLTPDPRYLYLSQHHREALDHLLYGINERRGFIAITGGIGTGKTTLCRALLNHMEENTKSALIFSSFISDVEILETINHEFGIEMGPGPRTKKGYIDALNRFLLDNYSSGGNALLLIDEAQNLSHTVLEQIRMLSNLETEKEKLIQIVLVGQSELKGVLEARSLRQLNERITVRYHLKPLGLDDLRGYVNHRLVVAGGTGNPRFTDRAFKKIYHHTSGNPRRINAVCDRALLIAYTGEKETITGGIIRKAIHDLGGTGVQDPRVREPWRSIRPFTIIILILLAVTAALAGWNLRDRVVDRFFKKELSFPMAKPPTSVSKQGKRGMEDFFLDERSSLTGLFDLFQAKTGLRPGVRDGTSGGDLDLGLVSFNVLPEYFTLFKKPFRVSVSGLLPDSAPRPSYLLICEVSNDGAVALNRRGNRRYLSRDFILKHWGGAVSSLYPYGERDISLTRGMTSKEVLKVQRTLRSMGYPVDPSGIFDDGTFKEVVRFQRDFGLKADGIVGRRTKALLYQIAE